MNRLLVHLGITWQWEQELVSGMSIELPGKDLWTKMPSSDILFPVVQCPETPNDRVVDCFEPNFINLFHFLCESSYFFLVSSFVLMKPTKQQNVKRPALQAHRAYYSCPQEKNGLKSLTFLVLGYQYDRDRHAALKCVR